MKLHVVLGAGQIGSRIVDLLLARGDEVRLVRHSASRGPSRPGLERLSGDVADPAFAARATAGASVVYDCMNPAYHRWGEELLPLARGALHGAAQAGAKLVALDCLYMYGRPEGRMNEDTPVRPCSKKGELRAALGELRLEAHRRGEVQVAIGRASDFFGAGLPLAYFGERAITRMLAGKSAEVVGDPDMPHSYTYAEDVARDLVVLGDHDAAMGKVWHLSTPAAVSSRALAAHLGDALGVEGKVTRIPTLALRALGVFSPQMREMVEMTYQWEVPYVIDDTRFRTTFGLEATPMEEACRAVAARYRVASAA